MKNIIVTTVDSSGVVAKNTLSDNGPTVINATKNANYEFFDNVKGYGPDHIITRRVDDDLKVSFDRSGTEEDLIIRDFYQENNNSALVGASKEGEPYYYIPDSAEQADYVTQLQDGAVQGNALGGEEFVQPWWMGGLPVLAALGIASIGSSDDPNPPNGEVVINPPTVTITEDTNNDGIISASELDGTVGVLITVDPATNVGDTLVITNPDGSMGQVAITQDIIDNGLVLEYPAPANGETIEVIAYVADPQENISAPSSDSAVVESPAIVSLSGDGSINENAGPASYTITLDKASDTDTVVTYEVQNQTTDSDDFTGPTTATVTIPAGQLSVLVEVGINDDGVYEGDENYNVVITEVTGGAQLGDDHTVNTVITDTDMMPSVSVDDVTVSESLMGEDVVATFTVTLSHPSTETVEVSFNTDADSALDGADYTGVSGTVTFLPGETTQTIEVPILDDAYYEADETFNVVLSSPVNATIDHNGIGTITDEEQYPDLVEVSIVDNYDAVNEGDTATFPIELRDEAGNLIVAATDVTVTVEYTGTAINGDDYTTVSTTVTIPAGASSVDLDIEMLTDLLDEGLENVVITVNGATGGGFEAIGVDADKCVADVDIIDSSYTTIEIDDVTVDEDAGNAVFTVTLTGDAPTTDVTVNYTTGDVTALDATDYTGVTGTLVFPVGTLTQTITVPILDDNIAEATETYSVTLSDAVNATILNSGVGTITDECNTDLDSVYVSIVDNVDSVYEGEVATFTVELRDADGNLNSAITDVTVDIHYSGVAIDGTDYTGVASVTIPANSSSVDFDITTLDDYIAEGSEIVNIELSSVTGGGFEAIAVDPTKSTADMNIVDDCCDAESVVVSILDLATDVIEGGNGVFPIELHDQDGNPISAITDTTVDIHYSGVGIDGTDFTGISTIIIPAGSQSNYLVLETIDDNFAEGSELVNIEIVNVSGGGFEAIGIDPDHNTADMNIVDDCDSAFVCILDFTTDVIEAGSGLFPIVLKDADGNAINAVTDVTVNIEYSGVAIDGTDFTGIASVVIPAGAQSTNLILQTLDDNIAEGSEIVNIELTSVSGGGFEAIALDPVMYVADMNIVDDCNPGDPVTVSISDDVDSIYEGESTYFPISLTNADSDPQIAITDVTVTIEYTGSATNGDDYTGSLTVVIPAGLSSVNLDINSLEDLLPEGNEIVDITITNPVGGGFEDILVNPVANTANVTIIDSTVEIVEVSPAQATEGTDLVHTVTLSAASSTDSIFSFDLTPGTATENVDYSNVVTFSDGVTFDPVTGDITVPAGVTSFTVTYPTIDDSYADDGETTTLEVGGVTGEGTINDELEPPLDPENPLDPVTVCIVDDVDSINEWAVNPDNVGTFPIEIRDQNGDLIIAATDVTVDVTYSGTATNGDDFTGVIQVTIPAGSSSVNLNLTVIDDLLAEGDEVVNITISNPVGGGFEGIGVDPNANTADMTIISDDYIQINVEPTAAFEGDNLVHVVTLSNPSMTDETFSFNLAEGTATEGVDYSNTVSFSDGVTFDPVTGEITVPAGVTSFTVTYPTIDDSYADDGETTTLTIGGSSATGTINDETPPDLVEVSIVDNYPEGDAGTVSEGETAVFPIELRDEDGNLIVAATDVTVTVEYTGMAANGDDYTTVSTTVIIPAGSSSVDLNIETLTDLLDEDLEDVVITITDVTGGGFEAIAIDADGNVADVGITDGDYYQVAVDDVVVDEDAGFAEFTVTLTGDVPPTADVSVDYATGDVTAVDGLDYTGVTGTMTFVAGTNVFTQTIQAPIIDDVYAELPETYNMTLSNAVNATILNNGIGTITDEYQRDAVSVSIVDDVGSIDEDAVDPDNVGSFPIEIRDQDGNLVTAETEVTVDVTYSGTADNGDDFTGVIQVTIPAGASSVDLDLTVIDDLLAEGDEIVDITISNPVGGGFEDIGINPDANTADMTIINDDDIQINVAPTTAFEGEDLVHVVTLSNPSASDQTYSFDLADGATNPATEGEDYSNLPVFSDGVTLDPVTGDITVPAGVTSFTVTYPTIDDSYADDGETTTLTIGGSSATGTINDETPPDLVEVSIVDNYPYSDAGTISEGETAVFPIELRDADGNLIVAATDVTVTVEYTGTAANGDDYTTVSTTVIIPASSSSVNLDIETLTDLLDEDLEDVVITITDVTGGGFESIAIDADNNIADVEIVDEPYYQVAVDNVTVNESTGFAEFTVTLTGDVPPAGDITVDYATSDMTAVDGVDYTGVTGTITFVAGTTVFTQTIQVPIIDDAIWEPTETYEVTLSNPSANVSILNNGTGTILDNDLLAVDDSAEAIEAGGIDNGSGSQDATGNLLTNDNPDQADATVTDIRVGAVEGSGTAGVLGTALVGMYGTLTVNADGTYVYEVNDDDATVQALNDGDSLTESFNYTMTDGTASDIAVLEIVIKGSNDCAIPTVTPVTVSEEGLDEFDPIPDSTGNNDTTDNTEATGSISFTDVDNFDISDFSIDLAGPTDITVKGEAVSWTWDDLTGQLTGQVVIEGESLEVMTVDVGPITTDGSGGFVADYNTTLLHAIDHPSNDDEDQLDVQFEASVSDGAQSATTNFAVTVEDDRPAQSESNIDIAAATSDSNITIILDTSGSMSTQISGGETRLDLAKAAIVKLLDGYDVAGDVKVQLITFAKEAQSQPQWMTIDELKASLPGIVADGGTNYDAALDVTMNSYDDAGAIFGANNYSYFLTDGEPTYGQGTLEDFGPGLNGTGYNNSTDPDQGIQTEEESLWTTFLNANDIKSYAFAFGPSVTDTNELEPIAYDGQIGEQGADDLTRLITDLNQLDDILVDTLPDVIDYGLVDGNLFGADEGHVLTFTLDGITYDYDGSDGSMTASSPPSSIYSYDQSTTTVTINTLAQGIMTLDFETGKYTYETQSLVVDYQEDITFTLIDDDGDSVQSEQTIFVYSLSAKDDSVITNDLTGALELDQAVLVGNDNTSPNSEVTTTFDVNGGQTSGVDPVIYTTTDFDDVNSFDYTISENDVSSSALVSIEYQQGDTGTVQGTNASETLVGREGLDDTLLGMDGNDILQGKSGDDVLTGGLREDTFIWTANDIDGLLTPDFDIITDFEAGDKLNLSDLLQGETIGDAANLADYLNWDAVAEVLSVSADGNFSGGYNAAQSDLNIQIDNYAGDFNNLVDNHII